MNLSGGQAAGRLGPSQPGGTPLSEDAVLQFLQGNGSSTLVELQRRLAGGAEELKSCLTSMQESWGLHSK